MKPTIYLETTVISYFVARPTTDVIQLGHRQITRQWWDEQLPRYEVFISELVLNEVSQGNPDAAERRIQAIREFSVLRVTPEAINLAAKYITELPLLRDAEADALHPALAVLNKVNFLVAWNYKHIARGSVIAALPLANAQRGLNTPVICTPEELLYETKKAWSDPIVDEIHEIRKKLVREAGGTLEALGARLMKTQERHGKKLVSRQRRRGA